MKYKTPTTICPVLSELLFDTNVGSKVVMDEVNFHKRGNSVIDVKNQNNSKIGEMRCEWKFFEKNN